jgi:hypothetical protein
MTVPDANFTAARIDAAQSFTGDQTLSTGNLVIGTSGKGIDFSATPGTGTSELLADYEEGNWTPSLGGNTTYTAQLGKYTKIGRMVYFSGDLTVNVLGTGNLNAIEGLPFSAAGNNAVFVGYFADLAVSPVSLSPFIGGTSINIYGLTAAAQTASGLNIFGDDARLMFSGFYEV